MLQPVIADAQRIVVDAGAGGPQPTLDTTANGVAQLNIATPNTAGLSHNHFTEFGVAPSGLVLNNATTATATQLGGIVYGNANLQGHSAKIILNEVTGSAASQLNGFTEVAGASAAVVLANPNGITCAGCGFINTPRVTLSTGTPSLGSDGSLQELRVRQGTVAFVGAGGNFTEVPVLDIVSRRVTVNGPVKGQAVSLTAGQVNYNYPSGTATTVSDGSSAPQFAIDTASMGGMYANRILMTVTEAGAGVRIDGQMAANTGDLTLTANGQLVLKGSLSAAGNIALSTQGMDAASAATVQAGGNIQLNQNGTLNNAGSVAATGGELAIAARSFNNSGTIQAHGKANLQVTQIATNTAGGKIIASNGDLVLSVSGLSNAGAIISGSGSLQVQSTGNVSNSSGVLAAQTGLTGWIGGTLDNTGGQIASASGAVMLNGDSTSLSMAGLVNTNGRIQAQNGDVRLQTQSYADAGSGIAAASGWMALLSTDSTLIQGQLTGNAGLVLSAGGLLVNGGIVGAQSGAVTIRSADMMNTGKITASSGNLAVAASSLGNTGQISVAGTILANVKGGLNNSGQIVSGSDFSVIANAFANTGSIASSTGLFAIQVSDASINAGGTIQGQKGISLQVGNAFDNTNGTILANTRTLSLNVAGLLGNPSSGQIIAQSGPLSVIAGSLGNAGKMMAQTTSLTLNVVGDINNAGGLLGGQTGVSLTGGDAFDNTNGTVLAATGDVSLAARNGLIGTGGKVQAPVGDVKVEVGSYTDAGAGAITASGQVSLNAANTLSVGVEGQITGGTGLQLIVGGALSNGGVIGSQHGPVTITGGATVNSGQIAAVAGDVSVTTSSLLNSGQIEASGAQTMTVSGLLSNALSAQIIAQGGALSVSAGSLGNAGYMIAKTTSLTFNVVGDINNAGGLLGGQTGVSLTGGGAFDNTNGTVLAATGDVSLTARNSLIGTGGKVQAPVGDVKVEVGSYTDAGAGAITASGQVSLNAANALSVGAEGQITGGTGLQLIVGGALSNGGVIGSQHGPVTITGGATVNSGQIAAVAGDVSVTTSSLLNSGQIEASGAQTMTVSGLLSNALSAQIIAQGGALSISAGSLGNAGYMIAKTAALMLHVASDISNAGGLLGGQTGVSLTGGGAFDNTNGTVLAATGDVSLAARNSLIGTGGKVQAPVGDVKVEVGSYTDAGAGAITASGQVSLNAANTFSVGAQGKITGGTGLQLAAGGALENAGIIGTYSGNITVAVKGTTANTGSIIANTGLLSLKAVEVTNSGTLSAGAGEMFGIIGTLNNTNGIIVTESGNIIIEGVQSGSASGQIINNGAGIVNGVPRGGAIVARQGTLSLNTGTLSGNGALFSAQEMTVTVSGNDTNAGQISAKSLTLGIGGMLINNGAIEASAGDLLLTSASLNNTGTIGAQSGKIAMTSGTIANTGSMLAVSSDLSLNAGSLNNSGRIAASKNVALSITNQMENSGSGEIAALGGSLQFSAGTFFNTATGASTGLLSAGAISGKVTGNVSNSGMIYGEAGVAIAVDGTLTLSGGSITAPDGDVVLDGLTGPTTGAMINNGGQIQASAGDVRIEVASYDDTASSIISAKEVLNLSASNAVSVQGNISGGQFVLSAGDMTNNGMMGALQGGVTISAVKMINAGLVQAVAGDISLQAVSLTNNGQIVASGQQILTVANILNNTDYGLISAKGGNLTISAGSFSNTAVPSQGTPTGLAAQGMLSASVAGDATNTGLFYGQSGVLLGARGALHNDGGIIAAGTGDITLRGLSGGAALAAMTNNGGSIQAAKGAVSVVTDSYSSDAAGKISAATALIMVADGSVNTAGVLAGGSNGLTINTSGQMAIMAGATVGAASGLVSLMASDLDNQGSLVAQNGNIALIVSGNLTNSSSITASSAVALNVGSFFVNDATGTVGSVNDIVTVQAGSFSNSGAISSFAGLFITDSGGATNTGTLLGKTGLVMNVAGILENKGIIGATTGDIFLAGIGNNAMSALVNSKGNIQANAGNVSINAGLYYDNALGQVRGSQSVTLVSAKSVTVGTEGALVGGQNLVITAGGTVVNGGSLGAQDGSVSVITTGDVLNKGEIQSKGTSQMMLKAASFDNDGSIISASSGSLQVAGELNNNKNARLVTVEGNFTISAGSLTNNGSIGAGGALNTAVSGDLSNQGMMVGKTGATLHIDGTLSNTGGSIIALAGSLLIRGLLNNSIALLNNANGTIQTGEGDLTIQASAQSDIGKISAANNLSLQVSGDFTAADFAGVASGKDMSLDIDGTLSIASGQSIGANGELNISANSLNNAGGLFSTTAMQLLVSGDITNTGLIYGSTDLSIGLNGVLTNNQGALIAENGNLTIGGRQAGNSASALFNHSGLIQAASSSGNINIDAHNITNDVVGGVNQISGVVFQKLYATNENPPAVDLSNFKSSSDINQYWTSTKHVYVPNPVGPGGVWFALYDQSAQSGILVEGTGASYVRNAAAALISAGGNLTINSSNGIQNDASHLSAGGNINLTGGSLNNVGYQGNVLYTTTCTGNNSCRSALPLVDPLPSNIPMPGWVIGAGHPVVPEAWFNAAASSVTGTIIAGGNITGNFTGTITNETKIAQATPSQMMGFGGTVPLPSTAAAPAGSNGAGSFIVNGNGGLGSMATLPGGLASTTGGLPNGAASYAVPGASSSLTQSQGGGGVAIGNLSMQGVGSVGGSGSQLPGGSQGTTGWGGNGNAIAINQGNAAKMPGAGGVSIGATSAAVLPQFQSGVATNAGSSSSSIPGIGSGPSTSQIIASVAGGNALFIPNPAPQAHYLIETNPNYTTFKGFYGSQYLLDRLGANSQTTPPFLGDAYFDTRYVAQQISDATGHATLSAAYSTEQAQMVALLNNAASQSQALGLQIGVDLTSEQVAGLDKDIVWYVPRIVNGQTVLVPQLYLAAGSRDKVLSDGAVLSGKDVTLKAAGLYNSGTVSASNDLSISVTGDIVNNGGTLKAGNDLLLQAGGSIISSSTKQGWQTMGGSVESVSRVASIVAGDDLTMKASQDIVSAGSVFGAGNSLEIEAGRNVSLGSLALSTKDDSSFGGVSRYFNLTQNLGTTLTAGKNAIVSAKDKLSLQGITLSSGGDTTLVGGQSLSLDSSTNSLSSTISGSKSGFGNSSSFSGLHDVTLQIGSSVNAGGNVTLAAGNGGITLNGSSVKAGGTLDAFTTGSITLNTVTSSETREASSSHTGLMDGRSQTIGTYDEHVQGSTLSGSNGLSLFASGSITGTAANLLSDHGAVSLETKNGDISLLSASERHDSWASYGESGVSFGGSGTDFHHNTVSTQTEAVLSIGSTVSGDTVSIVSGKDINIVGSGVVGTGNVVLDAAGDISIRSAQQTLSLTDYQNDKKAGVFSMGSSAIPVAVGAGLQQNSSTTTTTQVTNVASAVGSLSGDLTVHAGGAVTLKDAHLSSGGDMAIIGKSVTFDVSHDTTTQTQSQKTNFSGVTASLSGVVGNAYTSAAVAASDRQTDPRLQALDGGQAAYAGYQAYKAVDAATSSGKNGQLLQVDVMAGTSSSENRAGYFSSTAQGSSAVAGGNLSVVATSGDITARGATLSGGRNVALVSTGNIVLQSAENSTQFSNDNVSKSAAVGVYAGIGTQSTGYGVEGSASWAQGGTVASSSTPVNTVVAAGNTLTLISGKDTRLEGADVAGNRVVASIGGDLILKSTQATASGSSSQSGGSVNVQIGITGTSGGSVSAATDHIGNGYASVVSQTGIFAGNGGLNITVGGNTSLTGAVISSTAPANDNVLNTGSLTVSNVENHSNSSAVSVIASASSSGVGSGGGVSQTNDNAHSTTLSAITNNVGVTVRDGTVPSTLLRPEQLTANTALGTVTGGVAGSGGTALQTTNGVQNRFDPQQTRNDLAFSQGAANLFGQVANEFAGNLITSRGWSENDPRSLLLHSMIGALQGYIAGNTAWSAASGGLGAAGGTALTQWMGNYLIEHGVQPDSAEGRIILQLASGAVGAGIGALVNGQQGALVGASAAQSATLFNYLTHYQAVQKINAEKALAACKSNGSCSEDEIKTYTDTIKTLEDIDNQTNLAVVQACLTGGSLACLSQSQRLSNAAATWRAADTAGVDLNNADVAALKEEYQKLWAVDHLTQKIIDSRDAQYLGSILKGFDLGAAGGVVTAVSAIAAYEGIEAAATIHAMCGASAACYANYFGLIVHDIIATAPELGGSPTAPTLLASAIAAAKTSLVASRVGSALPEIYTSAEPMESEFPQLIGVNPHYSVGGRNNNCTSCANAVYERLTGKNSAAVADNLGRGSELDLDAANFSKPATVSEVSHYMRGLKSGQSRLIIILQPGDTHHAIVATNLNGKVYFIDGQSGLVVNLNSEVKLRVGYPNFETPLVPWDVKK
ncbi:hemagglutinin repeat-containing protein [Granulibacter bethesdensis]|uniref:hemagglutinin repeat-containing protein n=1 Tax=Granulibacter bethesdensis TaxID=364410 RepID=UPI00156153AD|nr:hemagglutinin repeat-containing protein [Granulibacter bethesdensis]